MDWIHVVGRRGLEGEMKPTGLANRLDVEVGGEREVAVTPGLDLTGTCCPSLRCGQNRGGVGYAVEDPIPLSGVRGV